MATTMLSSVNTTSSQPGVDPSLRSLSLPVGTLAQLVPDFYWRAIIVIDCCLPNTATSSSGSPLGNDRKGTIPSLQTPDQGGLPEPEQLKSPRLPTLRVAGAAAKPRGHRVSWWGPTSERPLLAGLWLEGFCHRGPSHTSGGHWPSSGLPHL